MADVWSYKNGKEISHNLVDIPVGFDNGTVYGNLTDYSVYIAGKTTTGSILLPENIGKDETFPVLYLLNGQGGNREWQSDQEGRIRQIMGYLQTDKQMESKRFIVVMPDIFNANSVSDNQKMHDYQSLLDVLMPQDKSEGLMDYVVKNYPAKEGKAYSSIAGLSMGAVDSLYLGFNLQNYFYSIGSFSPVSVLFSEELGWLDPNTRFIFGTGHDHFIFIGKGLNDGAVNGYPGFYRNKLNDFGNDNTYCTLPGEHDWSENNGPGPFRSLLYLFLQNKIFDF